MDKLQFLKEINAVCEKHGVTGLAMAVATNQNISMMCISPQDIRIHLALQAMAKSLISGGWKITKISKYDSDFKQPDLN